MPALTVERLMENEIMILKDALKRIDELEAVLSRLVTKVECDRRRGTPLHPKGYPECTWGVEKGYPAELSRAAELVEEDQLWRNGE